MNPFAKDGQFCPNSKVNVSIWGFFNLKENFLSLKCHYVLLDAFSRNPGIHNPLSKQNMKSFEWFNSQF